MTNCIKLSQLPKSRKKGNHLMTSFSAYLKSVIMKMNPSAIILIHAVQKIYPKAYKILKSTECTLRTKMTFLLHLQLTPYNNVIVFIGRCEKLM